MKIKLSLVAIHLSMMACYSQEVQIQEIEVKDTSLLQESLTNSKSVIKLEDEIQAISINDALDKEFFVEFKKTSEYASEPYIRGRGNKGVPVFLEGMRLNAGHDDSTNLFGLSDVAQIDVYRGANGAQLGMGAMSGAVVVKFKEPEFNNSEEFKVSGFANTKYEFLSKDGSTNSLGANLYNNFINFSLSGGVSDYNNYEDGNSNEVLHSQYDTSNFNSSVAIKTSKDSYVYARYIRDRANTQDPTSRTLNTTNNIWTYTDRPKDEAKNYFLGFRKESLAGFNDIDLQYFKNEIHYDIKTKREALIPEQQELFRESKTDGAKLSANKDLENHHLNFATTYSNMYISNGLRNYNYGTNTWSDWMSAFGITEGEIKSYMFNISDEIHYDKLFFNLAGGYEYVTREVKSNVNTTKYIADGRIPTALLSEIVRQDTDEQDNLFSFNATVGYEVSTAFIPYFKLSNATRTPYFNEQYGNNPANATQIPNQNLENEKVYGADIGADGQIGNAYYTSALYYQKYKDYIELVNTGYKTNGTNLDIKQFTNLDEADIYGAELMLGYKIFDDIYAQASYTYTRGKNKENNQPLAYIAPQKVTLSLAQKKAKGLSWEIEEELIDNQDKISTVNGEKETSGYELTNASISYAFGKIGVFKSTTLSFELNNIFDKDYSEHLTKASSTNFYLVDETGINGAVALQVKF